MGGTLFRCLTQPTTMNPKHTDDVLHSSADVSLSYTFEEPILYHLFGPEDDFEVHTACHPLACSEAYVQTALLEKGGGLERYGFESLSHTSANVVYCMLSDSRPCTLLNPRSATERCL